MMEAFGYLYPLDECRLSIKISFFLIPETECIGALQAGSVHKSEGGGTWEQEGAGEEERDRS